MQNNEELINAVLDGDRERYGELVGPYLDRLHAISYSYLGDVQLAEDVTQDALIKAYKALRTLAKPTSFGPWLQQITRNLSRSAFRRRKNQAIDLGDHDERVDTQAKDPSEAAQSRDTADLLREALSRMSPTISETIVLFYLKEQSIKEIAEFCDISENTVKQRLHRGRKLLRESLEEIALEEGRKDLELSEQFLPGLIVALPAKPAESSLFGGIVAKLGALPMLWPLLINLSAVVIGSGMAHWLLMSEVDPSNQAAQNSMRRSSVISGILAVGIVIVTVVVFSRTDILSLGHLKWLVLALPIVFLAVYFLRAGATWRMKLFVIGLFGVVICIVLMVTTPSLLIYALGGCMLLLAGLSALESTWLPALAAPSRHKISSTPTEFRAQSVDELHGNADKFLKILNTPYPMFHHISREADHVCFSAHPPLVGKWIQRLSEKTKSWNIPWCRFGSARLYPDGEVEYQVYHRESFPAHWGTVEEEEKRVSDYIANSWANYSSGNEAEARSMALDFFPENIYTHSKGRNTLRTVSIVMILLLIVAAALIFLLTLW